MSKANFPMEQYSPFDQIYSGLDFNSLEFRYLNWAYFKLSVLTS